MSLRMHFPHSGARIRLFEQNTDIINFGLFLFNSTQKTVNAFFFLPIVINLLLFEHRF